MKNILALLLLTLFAIGVFGESVSVKEGDSFTLNTGVQIKGDDLIEWRLNGTLIFRVSSSAGNISVSDNTNGAFGDRLKVDKLTGDLKITNIKTTDSGEYLLKIRSSTSSEKIFSVTVIAGSDPSSDSALGPGAIAGIVIGVLAAVAGVVGGIYYGYTKKGPVL